MQRRARLLDLPVNLFLNRTISRLSAEGLSNEEAFDEEHAPRSLYALTVANANCFCCQADCACGFTYQLHCFRNEIVFKDDGSWRSGIVLGEHDNAERIGAAAIQHLS